jgi:putative oxidoreductase
MPRKVCVLVSRLHRDFSFTTVAVRNDSRRRMFDIAWNDTHRVIRSTFLHVKQGAITMDQTFSKFQPIALSLFRFITGLLLFQYGIAKIFKFPVLPYFANIPPLITAAGAIELILGALLMIGLFSRISAFILSGEMAFAYFLGHMFKKPDEPVFLPLLNNGTPAILFCFACLYLSTSGPGPISIDAMLRGKK